MGTRMWTWNCQHPKAEDGAKGARTLLLGQKISPVRKEKRKWKWLVDK